MDSTGEARGGRQRMSGPDRLRIHGGSAMGHLIRQFDWSTTPLGPLAQWSESFVASLNIALASPDTFAIYWGDEHTLLYNDAYRGLLNEKHPSALGRAAQEVWREAWPVIGPQVREAYEHGISTRVAEAKIPILVGDQLKDGWFSYSFHPIYDSGTIVAVANPGKDDTAAVNARETLRASEARLNQVLDATTDAVVGVDRQWRLSYLNPAAVRTYGRGRNLLGKMLWEEFPKSIFEGSPYVWHYNRAMYEGVAGSFEAFYPEPLDIWIELEVYPTPDGIVTFSRDISEKMRSEQLLAQREQQLSLAMDAADMATWFYDPERNVIGGDAKMGRLFGLSVPEGPAEVWLAPIHPEDRERVSREFVAGLAGAPYDTEYRVIQTEGSLLWVRAKAQILQANGSKRMTGICEDITARKRADKELRDIAERLDLSQQTAKVASWRWELSDGTLFFDQGSNWTYGRAPSEMTSLPLIFSYIHEEDRQRVQDGIGPVIERGGEFNLEFRVNWPDGTLHWLQAFGRAILSAGGTPAGIIGINLDITERKLSETALIQNEKLAAVGRLASSIAHEINNPLEAVTNLLYLARTSDDLEQARTYLDSAEIELRRTSAIASQTLRFHRQSTRPVAVSCEELIDSVLTIHHARILNARVEVEKRGYANHPVTCFDGEIRQVISNLVGNAVDAMHGTGGRLLIRCREGHDWTTNRTGLVLTVADTGSGMSAATTKRIFNAFYTTKGIGGTGLGLWISQEIIARHKGWIRVRSSQKPGHSGTVFTIFLPFDAALRDGQIEPQTEPMTAPALL